MESRVLRSTALTLLALSCLLDIARPLPALGSSRSGMCEGVCQVTSVPGELGHAWTSITAPSHGTGVARPHRAI